MNAPKYTESKALRVGGLLPPASSELKLGKEQNHRTLVVLKGIGQSEAGYRESNLRCVSYSLIPPYRLAAKIREDLGATCSIAS